MCVQRMVRAQRAGAFPKNGSFLSPGDGYIYILPVCARTHYWGLGCTRASEPDDGVVGRERESSMRRQSDQAVFGCEGGGLDFVDM